MAPKILCIYYSQTGQLGRIIDIFLAPITRHYPVETVVVEPVEGYSFPWSGKDFFEAMPGSVLGHTINLKPFSLKHSQYDLIIFGYQPWFLSPSIPATSILKHPQLQRIMGNTRVITVIGARNMWLTSQEKVKQLLKQSEAELVGNVAFVDRHNNWASAVAIVYWLLYGHKKRFLGIFPEPGVSEKDIKNGDTFGELVLKALKTNEWQGLQPAIIATGGVEVKHNIMLIESKASRIFKIWAGLIASRKNRTLWLKIFKYYLAVALFIVSPVVVLIDMLLIRPFTIRKRNIKRRYYMGTSLSTDE